MSSERDVLEVFDRANPVPDPDLVTVEPDAGRFLADLLDDGPIVVGVETVDGQSVTLQRRWLLPAVAAAVVGLVVVGLVAFGAGDAEAPTPADTTPATPAPATTTPSVPATTVPVAFEDPLADLTWDGDENLVAPGVLPEPYEVLAALPGRVIIGGDTVPELTFRAGDPVLAYTADKIEIDGVEWWISEDGERAPIVLQRQAPHGFFVVIESYASRDLTIQLAGLAEPVSAARLGVEVLDPSTADREVAAIGDVTLKVAGTDGFYCGVLDGGTIGSAQGNCRRVEPDAPVATFAWLRDTETVYTAGVAGVDVASIEFLDADDRTLGVVKPAVSSSGFAEQFWITDAFDPTEAERVVVVRGDGTRAELTQGTLRIGSSIPPRVSGVTGSFS
jgi:hypothetical protein